ncbi:MAG TPA: cupredoxin domain-containing protein [Acidimicrobiales bacterium]|nr:cupredoxin domain-containing protein [Acidimicrobiales bacterium]
MAKSAVLTQPSRIFLPVSIAGLVLAVLYGAFTGDWLATSLYLLLFGVAGFAGVVVAGFRVNDAPARVAPDADSPTYHEVVRAPLPAGGAWPLAAALAVTLILLGFVVGPMAAYFGMGVGLATIAGWLARVSSDTTGREINLLPVGLPVLGLFCIAALMFFMSRILLAVPEQASTFIALMVAIAILGLATLLALRPSISGRTMITVLSVLSVAMVVGGLVAAAAGERHIELHGGEAAHGEASEVEAKGIAFDLTELHLPANTDAEIVLKNKDDRAILHNISIYGGADAKAPPILKGDLVAGAGSAITYHFKTPAAGDYYFQCDIHPNMNGTAKVA